ncbi:MAG: hypothetical protein HGA45_21775 [Chloroflexales bacterium]|nr:hypothetical protein [Chloroflexales bacterium]
MAGLPQRGSSELPAGQAPRGGEALDGLLEAGEGVGGQFVAGTPQCDASTLLMLARVPVGIEGQVAPTA